MLTAAERREKIWDVVRVSSGNFLEMYDFMVFGYFAGAIGAAFFPGGDSFASLMKSLIKKVMVFFFSTWFRNSSATFILVPPLGAGSMAISSRMILNI